MLNSAAPCTADYAEQMRANGFAVFHDVISAEMVAKLVDVLAGASAADSVRRRGGDSFGIRNLLNTVPAVRELAESDLIRSIVEPIIGLKAKVVRGIFFDKTPQANWKVTWHQDLTIAVRQEKHAPGFDGWSRKARVPHVRPPDAILEQILTLRVHLDDSDESNGALRIIPGSHQYGRLDAERIAKLVLESSPRVCEVRRGGVLVMRPLLLHASSAAQTPAHRRVVHLEFSAAELPGGLEWHGS